MIKKKCFENNWIISKYKEIKADPILIEKAIYAFELLGSLIENNVNLIFKGGTGLMLLIPELKRLSIDIDILNESDNESLNNAFNRIIEGGIFNRWEENKRTSNYKIAKKHFKFFYNSSIEKRESYILLDIVQSNYSFLNTTEKSINLPLFEIEKEIKVMVPTINSYVGDKLTAFAPKTIGIPYGKNKSMEIIKQLFDLGILFEHITSLKEISQIYKKISKTEASYRDINTPINIFLNDSINIKAGQIIKGKVDKTTFSEEDGELIKELDKKVGREEKRGIGHSSDESKEKETHQIFFRNFGYITSYDSL